MTVSASCGESVDTTTYGTGVWSSPNVTRDGQCCDWPSDRLDSRCIRRLRGRGKIKHHEYWPQSMSKSSRCVNLALADSTSALPAEFFSVFGITRKTVASNS